MRESSYAYPIIMSTHLACIAVFGGMILMTDLRLMRPGHDRRASCNNDSRTAPVEMVQVFILMVTWRLSAGEYPG